LLSIPNTADESVKYLTASNSIFNESIILCASLTANSAPTSSILGIDILHLGATLVLPAKQWWANLDQAPKDLDKTIFRDLSPTPKP
jgi:hypothetical protein